MSVFGGQPRARVVMNLRNINNSCVVCNINNTFVDYIKYITKLPINRPSGRYVISKENTAQEIYLKDVAISLLQPVYYPSNFRFVFIKPSQALSKDILFQTGTPCQGSFNFLYHGVPDLSRAAAEEFSKPVQPPSTKACRDEISRSGEPLTPIYIYI